MTETANRLKFLELGFRMGGAAFVLLGGCALFLVSQDGELSAGQEWIPIACMALAGAGLVLCAGSQAAEGVVVEGALRRAYTRFRAGDPNATPNAGQLAMLAGLPDSRAWQARAFLRKRAAERNLPSNL